MLNTEQVDVYTDLNGLAELKKSAKSKTPAAIKEVARQFESIFVGMMLKSMRQAKLADGIFDSQQSKFYQDMYDQQLSLHLSGETGMGLADVIARQLSPKQDNLVTVGQGISDYARQVVLRNAIKPKSLNSLVDVTGIDGGNDLPPVMKNLDSAETFINQLMPYAQKAAKQLGVDANILLAQAALETGWGKSVIHHANGQSSYNLFNIKANKSWAGKKAYTAVLEYKQGIPRSEMAGFRAYDSYQESFDDYVQLIKTNPRYARAIKAASKVERYMHELQQAGYATDPHYADKVLHIYRSKFNDSSSLAAQKS